MKISRNIQLAIGFVAVLSIIALLVWGYASLTKSTSSPDGTESSGFFGSLFPFKSPGVLNDILNGGGDDQTTPTGTAPVVRHVTEEKVAGATFATGLSGTLSLRYVERETGHIYETPVDSLSQTRLTNTTVPAVHDALWTSASTTIMRFLAEDGHVENFAGSLATSSGDQVLQGSFLKNYTRLAAGGKDLLLGVLESQDGSTVQVVAKGKATTLLTSPIRSWVPYVGGKKLLVASAPSAGILGSVFDITDGRMTQVGESMLGLDVRPSPSGDYLLVNAGAGRSVVTLVYDLKTGASSVLPFTTLVEKCAWIKNREPLIVCAVPKELPATYSYPDDWLLGRVHTNDSLWFYDVRTGTPTQAVDLSAEVESPIDASDMVASDDGMYVAFRDKNDSSLWAAKITTPQ